MLVQKSINRFEVVSSKIPYSLRRFGNKQKKTFLYEIGMIKNIFYYRIYQKNNVPILDENYNKYIPINDWLIHASKVLNTRFRYREQKHWLTPKIV